MNRRFLKNLLIILLASTLVFAVFKYISYLKENIGDLEIQKQNLLQELEKEKDTVEKLKSKNNLFKNNLQAVHKRLNRSFLDSKLSEKRFGELNSRVSVLKAENSALTGDKIKLTEENEAFKATLTSITDLKAIIRELNKLKRQAGNRGLLIKSGQNTAASKVRIEVVPAPSK